MDVLALDAVRPLRYFLHLHPRDFPNHRLHRRVLPLQQRLVDAPWLPDAVVGRDDDGPEMFEEEEPVKEK